MVDNGLLVLMEIVEGIGNISELPKSLPFWYAVRRLVSRSSMTISGGRRGIWSSNTAAMKRRRLGWLTCAMIRTSLRSRSVVCSLRIAGCGHFTATN